ncbi:RDD family protein [Acaricomes phytoseiuli]|uniref:RDD family protein n=1 Tax=Acaricomes phytoseiuli TaxID=291968 RepID=UPI0003799559|nr:RDD family protein [Acaricomes phytoseiuli]MCW1249350.1 RDD family protein [Acaricomes phytoseiuli]
MPEGVIQASLIRRSAAYILDLLIFALPVAVSAVLVFTEGFSPLVGPGIVGLTILAATGVFYALILVTMLTHSGQSLGKRITGLRVVSAETGHPAKFSATLLRGAAFFGGILSLAAGPLLAWQQLRKNPSDETSWQHKLGGSTVLDIRQGVDPLNIEPAYYPIYPEEWVSPEAQAKLNTYPPAPKPWSAAYRTGETAPGPKAADAPGEDPQRSSTPKEHQPGTARPAWLIPGLQAVASFVIIGALATSAAWTSNALQPSIHLDSPTDFSAVALAQQKVPLAASVPSGFPGFADGPTWQRQLGAAASAVSTEAGTFIFDNRKLTILDNRTGETINELPLDGDVAFTQETRLGEEAGLIWRSGNQLYGWAPSMGESAAVAMDIDTDAQVSAAGTNILVQNDEGKFFTPDTTGLVEMTHPEGAFARSVDDGKLISTRSSGTLTISSPDGKDRQDIPLNAPQENLQFVDWVTAGHGLAVTLWSAYPNSSDANSPITISTYRLTTGELLSSLEVTKSRVDENPSWNRGKGFVWASYAGYAYNLSNGLPIQDITAQNIKVSDILGNGIIGELSEGTVFLQEEKATLFSGIVPLAIAQDGIVLISTDRELQRFTP